MKGIVIKPPFPVLVLVVLVFSSSPLSILLQNQLLNKKAISKWKMEGGKEREHQTQHERERELVGRGMKKREGRLELFKMGGKNKQR